MTALTQLTLTTGATRLVTGDHLSNGDIVAATRAQGGGMLRFEDADGEVVGVEAAAVIMVEKAQALTYEVGFA